MLGQSPKGEKCEICKERAERHQTYQEKFLDMGDAMLAEALKAGKEIKASLHSRKRGVLRCFSDSEIANAVRNGAVIERQKDLAWLISSSVKVGEKKYRLIHVAVIIGEVIFVKTAYDPKTMPWKWDSTFSKRVCWCKKFKNEV
jgi:exosome complex RNA-binding protein Rrp4